MTCYGNLQALVAVALLAVFLLLSVIVFGLVFVRVAVLCFDFLARHWRRSPQKK